MLQLHQVSKRFGAAQVLYPTDLDIEPGKTTVLIGPSGCGKSTLLRLMVGLIQPDTGTVSFDGVPLRPDNLLTLRHRMGYVIQDGGLFPHLTARANVTIMSRYLKRSDQEIQERIAKLAELTHFPADALDRYPAQISGGQRQRVGIMRALMLDPAVLLLDEPMGALDPLIRFDLQEDLKQIFQTLKKTVVLVTHDMGEAGFFGDRVILLGGGRIVQQGTLHELIRCPGDDFVRRFINAQRLPSTAPGNNNHEERPNGISAQPVPASPLVGDQPVGT
jgi:osmoprotectant transport system ATP-binding protein